MATRKLAGHTKSKNRNVAAALLVLHAEYVTPRPPHEGEGPSLAKLARVYGVPYSEADRARVLQDWDVERAANEAEAWRQRCHPNSPRDEAGFVTYFVLTVAGAPNPLKAPERFQIACATARSTWWRSLAKVARWEAICAERALKAAHPFNPAGKGEV